LGQAARRLILQRYDWDACLSGFDDLMRPSSIETAPAPALTGAGS
jgi:hypothetical protein